MFLPAGGATTTDLVNEGHYSSAFRECSCRSLKTPRAMLRTSLVRQTARATASFTLDREHSKTARGGGCLTDTAARAVGGHGRRACESIHACAGRLRLGCVRWRSRSPLDALLLAPPSPPPVAVAAISIGGWLYFRSRWSSTAVARECVRHQRALGAAAVGTTVGGGGRNGR